MKTIKITAGESGSLYIKLPYDPEFIKKIKTAGKYQWLRKRKLWKLEDTKSVIRHLINSFNKERISWSFSLQLKYRDIFFNGFDKLIDELIIRRYSRKTFKAYLYYNRSFLQFCRKDAEEITNEDVKKYLYFLSAEKNVSNSTINIQINALKFYYAKILNKTFIYEIPRPRKEHQLPVILNSEELIDIFNSANNLKHKALLILSYSGGLRVSDAVRLKPADIDFQRKTIFIKAGKGKKDRYTILSDAAITCLKKYTEAYSPDNWLFEGQKPGSHISQRTAQKVFENAVIRAGIKKEVTFHSLRHSFSTHLLENGTDIRYIQDFLGHKSIKTTEIYTHVTRKKILNIRSPMDSWKMEDL